MKVLPVSNYYQNESMQNIKKVEKTCSPAESNEIPFGYYSPVNIINDYFRAIPFRGLTAKGVVKQRGMLMHITHLPATRSFCGQFGDIQTTKFINWLAKSKQTHWILNPLNAIDDNLCPYSGDGRFSRNKFIVNLNKLIGKEYGEILKENELPEDIYSPVFTYDMLAKQKNPRFELAYSRFKNLSETTLIKQEYNKFLEKNNKLWLDEYANFDAISKSYGKNWLSWDKDLQIAPEIARSQGVDIGDIVFSILKNKNNSITKEDYDDKIGLYKFEQFLFDKQFHEMVEELDSKGVRLVLDLPIGISSESIDTWGKKNIFLLDDNFKPKKVSGCPPDGAISSTQVWGHALYDYDSPDFWEYQEASLKQLLELADLRLDHFVGYVNRATIPTEFVKEDGTILKDGEIFAPKKQGGMGANFFKDEWIENIDGKRSPKGENVFELFTRVARDLGRKPEDTYILESFGVLAGTPAYKNFEENFGKDFITQRVPIAMGIYEKDKELQKLNSVGESEQILNLAYLTGNHDMPSLHQFTDTLLGEGIYGEKVSRKIARKFKNFCKKELNLTKEEFKNPQKVFENVFKWHYTKNVKQVQTTIQDALGIYWRPNIPGSWNGMKDKYLQKPTTEALLPFWSYVFPKDFLDRENLSGVNPGYKSLADKFVNLMNELFPEKT